MKISISVAKGKVVRTFRSVAKAKSFAGKGPGKITVRVK
jgi:hypothetical protein